MKTCSTRSSTSRTMSSRSRRVLRRSSSCSVRNLCRSSRAENSSSASGLIRPSWASARSAMRSRFCCSSRTYGVGSGSTSRILVGQRGRRRHELVGTVVADERLEVEAELVERPLLELLHPHPLLGAQHLVAVHGVGQRRQLGLELAHLAAHRGRDRCSRPDRAVLDRRYAARPRRPANAPAGPAPRARPCRPRRRRAASRIRRSRRSLARACALSLLLRRLAQAVGAAVQRAGPLLGGAQREPGLHLGLARQPARPRRDVDARPCRAPRPVRPGGGREPLLELGEPGDVVVAGLLGRGDRGVDPLRLGTATDRASEPS